MKKGFLAEARGFAPLRFSAPLREEGLDFDAQISRQARNEGLSQRRNDPPRHNAIWLLAKDKPEKRFLAEAQSFAEKN